MSYHFVTFPDEMPLIIGELDGLLICCGGGDPVASLFGARLE